MRIFLVSVAVVTAIWVFLSIPRLRRATLLAAPMGNYLRAREKGATAEEAIADSLRILRYRAPWSALSDDDLSYAAHLLGSLPDPSVFSALMVEVEETRDLRPITDRAQLNQFVQGARNAAAPSRE